jgi:hypothetical protein
MDEVLPPMFDSMAARLDAAADSGEIIDLQQVLLDLTTRFFGKVAYDVCLISCAGLDDRLVYLTTIDGYIS